MIDILAENYIVFVAFAAVTVLGSLYLFNATRRYKRRREGIYSVFMDMNRREAIIVASSLLSLGLVVYFVAMPDSFSVFGACLIIISELFSLAFCFNFRIILIDVLTAIVSVISLQLIALTKSYVSEVYDDTMVLILIILSTAAVCAFATLMCIRKVEIILKRNKFIRRNNES